MRRKFVIQVFYWSSFMIRLEKTRVKQSQNYIKTACKQNIGLDWHASALTLTLPGPSAGVSGSLDSYCSLKPLCSGMMEVVPARTSPTLLPHPLALCCHYPVSKCRSASIAVTGTVRVKERGIIHSTHDCYHEPTQIRTRSTRRAQTSSKAIGSLTLKNFIFVRELNAPSPQNIHRHHSPNSFATKYPQTFIVFQSFGECKLCQGLIMIRITAKIKSLYHHEPIHKMSSQ